MRFLLIFFVSLFSSIGATAYPLQWANGEWGISSSEKQDTDALKLNCQNDPISIYVNGRKESYKSTSKNNPSSLAKIIDSGPNFIKIQYHNEKRVDSKGNTQIWVMYFLDKDSFVWVRQDWIVDGKIKDATVPRVRCENQAVS